MRGANERHAARRCHQSVARESVSALRNRLVDTPRHAQCAPMPLRRRWRDTLPKRGAGPVGAEEARWTVEELWTRVAPGEDTDRLLQRHQSSRGLPGNPVHLPRLYVPTATSAR